MGSGPSDQLVNATVEQAVVDTTWAGFSTALVANDFQELATYATLDAARAMEGSLYCGCAPTPSAYTNVSFSAPPQSTYPAYFLAQFAKKDYAQRSLTEQVMFVQSTAGAPWLVDYVTDSLGSGGLLPPSANLTATPPAEPSLGSAPQSFATYFQALDNTGKTTSSLPTGYSSDTFIQQLITTSSHEYADDKATGEDVSYTHTISDVSPRFATAPSPTTPRWGAEMCFVMTEVRTYKHSDATPLVQTGALKSWTALLPAGSYSMIHETFAIEVCVLQYSPSGRRLLIGNLGGVYAASGTPAS